MRTPPGKNNQVDTLDEGFKNTVKNELPQNTFSNDNQRIAQNKLK